MDWKTVRKALSVIEFSENDIEVRLYSTLTVFWSHKLVIIFKNNPFFVFAVCVCVISTCLESLLACCIWETSNLTWISEGTRPSAAATATRCTGCQRWGQAVQSLTHSGGKQEKIWCPRFPSAAAWYSCWGAPSGFNPQEDWSQKRGGNSLLCRSSLNVCNVCGVGCDSSVFISWRCSVPFLWNTQCMPGTLLPKPSMAALSTGWSTRSTTL